LRRFRIRLTPSPDAKARSRLEAALATLSPAPGLHWDGEAAGIEYAFPDPGFDEIWRAVLATDARPDTPTRWRATLCAILEHNEREFLRRPGGWQRHVDRLHLACAATAAPAAAGGSRLWRKHERSAEPRTTR